MISTYWKTLDGQQTFMVTCQDFAGIESACLVEPNAVYDLGAAWRWGDEASLAFGNENDWVSVCYVCNAYDGVNSHWTGYEHMVRLIEHVQISHESHMRDMRKHSDFIREQELLQQKLKTATSLLTSQTERTVGPVSSLTCTRCRQDVDYVRATDGVCEPCVAAELTHKGVVLARDVLRFVSGGEL